METKSRRRAEGSRPSDLLTSCLHLSRLSRSKRPTSVPGGTMRTFPASSGYSDRNFSFVIVETARKRRHRGFRARRVFHPAGGPVEEAHPLFPHVAHPEPVGDAVHGKEVGLEDALVGVDEIDVLPRDGPVGEPGKARCGERPGKADDGDTVKGNSRRWPRSSGWRTHGHRNGGRRRSASSVRWRNSRLRPRGRTWGSRRRSFFPAVFFHGL